MGLEKGSGTISELKLESLGPRLTNPAVRVIDLCPIFQAKSLTPGGERHIYLIVKACHADDGDLKFSVEIWVCIWVWIRICSDIVERLIKI